MTIEAIFQQIAQGVALGIEAAAVLFVAVGAIEAVVVSARSLFRETTTAWDRRAIWIRFAGWILMSLEFALGADVIRTAISPSWDDIGKLGAIATIRTALSFFLTRDIEREMVVEPVDTGTSTQMVD